jgi:hypothetical protein
LLSQFLALAKGDGQKAAQMITELMEQDDENEDIAGGSSFRLLY